MVKISKMTPEQVKQMQAYRAGWVENGLSTERHSDEEVRDVVREVYRTAGLKEPVVVVMSSPLGCLVARNLVARAFRGEEALDVSRRSLVGLKISTRSLSDVINTFYRNVGRANRSVLYSSLRPWAITREGLLSSLKHEVVHSLTATLLDQVYSKLSFETNDDVLSYLSKLSEIVKSNIGGVLRGRLIGSFREKLVPAISRWLGKDLHDEFVRNFDGANGIRIGRLLDSHLYDDLTPHELDLWVDAVLWGQHDVGWAAYYDFPRNLGVKYAERDEARLDALLKYTKTCGWLYAYEGIAFVSQKQSDVHCDQNGNLHCESGPALAFADGFKVYSWRGINVPPWFIEEKDRITAESIALETNTELRRVMCEIIGWDKALEMFGGEVVDSDVCLGLPRKLISTNIRGEKITLLHMTNGTVENGVRRQFVEGVPNTIKTCHEAVAWQCGVPVWAHQEAVRT